MPDSTPAPDAQPAIEQPTTETTQNDNTVGSTSEPQSDYEPSWFSALDKAFEEAESSEKSPAEAGTQEEPEDNSESTEKPEPQDKAARVAELEAKLSQLESVKSSDSTDPEALKSALSEKDKAISEYERELAISRFEATQEYKESVVAPMAAILGVVEDLAKEYDISEKAILNVLEEPSHKRQGELISDLASNFSERDRFSLYQLGDDYAAIIDQRDTLRAKASEALAAREKAAQLQEANKFNESRKAWGNSVKSVWETFKSKVPLPSSPEEQAKFESEVMSQVSNVNFDKLSDDHKAFAAYSGAVLPEVLKRNKSLSSEVSELKTALKKYQKATPGAGSGTDSKRQDVDSSLSFLDSIEKHFVA
jgi:hypothetical protein